MGDRLSEGKFPFQFMACWELHEMLGRRANDVQELLEALEEIPLDSIYFHTHSYFLRHAYIAGPYPNDFANWAAIQVRDRVLGERLAVLDPFELGDLERLRVEIMSILDDHLSEVRTVPRVVYGESFYFMQSRILAVPAGARARTLSEFREGLERVDTSSVYYHVFDAMARKTKRRNELAGWLEDGLGDRELAARFAAVNPYVRSLEGLRAHLVQLCREAEGSGSGGH